MRAEPIWTSTIESGPHWSDLTSLYSERDDNEDGGGVGEVAGTLEDGKENVDVKTVSGEFQLVGQNLERDKWEMIER